MGSRLILGGIGVCAKVAAGSGVRYGAGVSGATVRKGVAFEIRVVDVDRGFLSNTDKQVPQTPATARNAIPTITIGPFALRPMIQIP